MKIKMKPSRCIGTAYAENMKQDMQAWQNYELNIAFCLKVVFYNRVTFTLKKVVKTRNAYRITKPFTAHGTTKL